MVKKILIGHWALTLLISLGSVFSLAHAQEPEKPPVLVGAGDIALCSMTGDEATARLLDEIEGTVFTAGDNAYPHGSAEQFRDCYGPSWGRHKARTRPTLGNHDYATRGAVPYFEYFGRNAGPPGRGYYSYILGEWLILSLNSNVDARHESYQGRWLRETLEANPTRCALAYFHHPLFSSRVQGYMPRDLKAIWQILYEYGVDVVINGNVHAYERFAPQDPDGKADSARGIRQFIVGTGGAPLSKLPERRLANSEVWNSETWGVLKLTLHPTSYEWEFIPVEGSKFRDSGSVACVEVPGQP